MSSTLRSTVNKSADLLQETPAGGLRQAIQRARAALLARQNQDGHWRFELEADSSITAEYILMMHYMDEIDCPLQEKLAGYLRATQMTASHGGWPLYHGGAIDLSCTVKAYYALKAAGDDPGSEHMLQTREAVLALGGAARCMAATRVLLAQFEQLPWRGVPYMPVELMLLPRWMPFHIEKISYWARVIIVPLSILCSLKAKAINPHQIGIRELFVTPPEQERHYFDCNGMLDRVFLALDRMGRALDRWMPGKLRKKAIGRAEAWFLPRMNGEDGIGGIFTPMVHSYQAMALLGYPKDHPDRQACLRSIQKLVVHRSDGVAYCQSCVSPVWDSGWSATAILRSDNDASAQEAVARACNWLAARQELECMGDWAVRAPNTAPGGWAFQYANAYYPDIDDTALVATLLHLQDERCGEPGRHRRNIDRAADWIVALQSRNGGFGAFDADNTRYYLNAIPFAHSGVMIDPPTEDVSGRVLAFLGMLSRPQDHACMQRCITYLRAAQQSEGSWWARWGSNYIYGTWSVITGLVLAGENPQLPYIRKAICWLRSRQHADGGWGESNDSYIDPLLRNDSQAESTPHSTAWALLAQLAVGEGNADSVRRGIDFLLKEQRASGVWSHPSHNAPGHPRMFYLKYHGYPLYFPLLALAGYEEYLLSQKA